ncbi:MAG: hypothetical protein ACYS0G_09685 [Planctomycetota bacterium]
MAILLFVVVALPAPGNTATVGPGGFVQMHDGGPGGGIGPIASWLDDLIDDLEDIEEDLEDAAAGVGNNTGPLEEPEKLRVSRDLDRAMATIDRILDPDQYPSLSPPGIGSTNTSVDPETLPEYADECALLAKDAVDEALSTLVDMKAIGSHLKTIRNLITRTDPHNYRSKAGITSQG